MTEQATTLSESVFNELRQDILDCVFKPGDKLLMSHLKERYEGGTSPIREALCKLTATGYVVSEPQRGFTVAPVSLEDLNDMYQTRIQIDTLTLGMAIESGDEHWEADILSAFHCMRRQAPKFLENAKEDVAIWHKRQMHFYNALMSACPLKNLLCVQRLLLDRSERYRYLWFYSSADSQSFKDAIDSVEHIVDATLARKKDEAMRLLGEHIQHAVDIMASKLSASQ